MENLTLYQFGSPYPVAIIALPDHRTPRGSIPLTSDLDLVPEDE